MVFLTPNRLVFQAKVVFQKLLDRHQSFISSFGPTVFFCVCLCVSPFATCFDSMCSDPIPHPSTLKTQRIVKTEARKLSWRHVETSFITILGAAALSSACDKTASCCFLCHPANFLQDLLHLVKGEKSKGHYSSRK